MSSTIENAWEQRTAGTGFPLSEVQDEAVTGGSGKHEGPDAASDAGRAEVVVQAGGMEQDEGKSQVRRSVGPSSEQSEVRAAGNLDEGKSQSRRSDSPSSAQEEVRAEGDFDGGSSGQSRDGGVADGSGSDEGSNDNSSSGVPPHTSQLVESAGGPQSESAKSTRLSYREGSGGGIADGDVSGSGSSLGKSSGGNSGSLLNKSSGGNSTSRSTAVSGRGGSANGLNSILPGGNTSSGGADGSSSQGAGADRDSSSGQGGRPKSTSSNACMFAPTARPGARVTCDESVAASESSGKSSGKCPNSISNFEGGGSPHVSKSKGRRDNAHGAASTQRAVFRARSEDKTSLNVRSDSGSGSASGHGASVCRTPAVLAFCPRERSGHSAPPSGQRLPTGSDSRRSLIAMWRKKTDRPDVQTEGSASDSGGSKRSYVGSSMNLSLLSEKDDLGEYERQIAQPVFDLEAYRSETSRGSRRPRQTESAGASARRILPTLQPGDGARTDRLLHLAVERTTLGRPAEVADGASSSHEASDNPSWSDRWAMQGASDNGSSEMDLGEGASSQMLFEF